MIRRASLTSQQVIATFSEDLAKEAHKLNELVDQFQVKENEDECTTIEVENPGI